MTDHTDSSGATKVDTLVGRLVIEQGLATQTEVQSCMEQIRERADVKDQSLSHILVRNAFLTEGQAERLLKEIEAQKSTQQIPGYSIKRKLGAGAMASVYLARQRSLDRYVAIKVLPRKFSSNPQFIERFYREGRAAAKLNHPNIVQAFDVGQSGEFHYFVMEYVSGKTVYDDIQQRGKYSEADAINHILQIADALDHAHKQGLVHRDVKPKNIMITKEGIAKLADMGLARAVTDEEAAQAEKGRAFGTPYYISPEQIRGEVDIGPQADIYSLGATFYHMVTGQVPFDGDDPTAVMHKHLKAELIPPDHVNPKLSAGVSEIIEMMMHKKSKRRYRSAKDLISDLKLVRDGHAPSIAHRDMDLSGLTSGTAVSHHDSLDDTTVSPALRLEPPSVFSHPAVLFIVVLAAISFLGNLLLAVLLAT